MNNFIKFLVSSFLFFNLNASLDQLSKLFNLDKFGLEKITQNKTFASQIDKEIESLKKIKVEQIDILNSRRPDLENIKSLIEQFKEKEKEKLENQDKFSNKYLMLLSQSSQTLTEINNINQQIINSIDLNIKILYEFKLDPEFKNKSLRISSKSIYFIEDIQKLTDLMLLYDKKTLAIEEKIRKSSIDLDQLKKSLALAKQEYEEKKKEQREFKPDELQSDLTLAEKAQILDEQEKLSRYKKILAEFKVKELEQKKQLFEIELKINNIQFEIIVSEYEKIKNDLCVDDKDIKKYEEGLKKIIQEEAEVRDSNLKKINSLEFIKSSELKKINGLRKKYRLSDAKVNLIKEWILVPNKLNNWSALLSIGKISNYLNYELNIGKEELIAQIESEKAKVVDKQIENSIVNTWHKITTGKLNNSIQGDLIAKEIKNYEKEKTDLIANISTLSDRQAEIINYLNSNNSIIDNIRLRMTELQEQKDTTFKDNQDEYLDLLNQLKIEGFDDGPKRNESITQLVEIYNNIINNKKITVKKIDIIIEELKTRIKLIGMSVFIKGIKNFIPDMKSFFNFLYQKNLKDVLSTNKKDYYKILDYYKKFHLEFGIILFNLIIILLTFIILRIHYLKIINLFKSISPKYGVGLTISNFIVVSFEFLIKNSLIIFIWLLAFLLIKYKFLTDNYTVIMFYLFSIPIWFFLAYKYIKFLSDENLKNNYFLIDKEYQRRFLTVLPIMLYSTILILFLKEGFMLSPLAKSNITIILQALQFVILQISLIFILSKEQILNLIPKTNNFWQWLHDQFENYYYLFLSSLIFIFIMSNPYLGYGRQFFYFFSRFILILFLVPLVMAVHNRIKRLLTSTFFYSENDGIKERFAHARTFYGAFVILTFIIFIAMAALLAANILGYEIGFGDLYDLIHKEIYPPYRDPDTGQIVSVNSLSFFYVALWIVGGIICSYIVNKFILSRIFDLLIVNIGIQNAIISLVRYTIIVAAFIIGLKRENMGFVAFYILAIIGTLSFAAKEIITDLIGYFIILIQRPVKIGDFIKITDSINGIVRHVNLRSVILRKKNSVTVIVPNSQIISNPIINWNYSRSYFAFEDMFVTVPYSSDPEKVKDFIYKVIDSNINVLKNPVPIVWLHDFTENGYQFLIRGYISFDRVLEQWAIASDLRLAIVRILKNNNIQIASPVRLIKLIDNANTEKND